MRKSEVVFNSVFAEKLRQFVAHKRALGYKYVSEEIQLSNFDRWCGGLALDEADLENAQVNSWQNPRNGESAKSHANRAILFGQFAAFLRNSGDSSYVMPTSARIPNPTFVPHIFTQSELTAIFSAIDSLRESKNLPHSKEIYPTLFRMLYGCGLRVSEVSNLKKSDVDCGKGVIIISGTKGDADRLVPMSEALTARMKAYMGKMMFLVPDTLYVFPNRSGESIAEVSIYGRFRDFLFAAGIPHHGRGKEPRLHDFRHTFAVHSLQKMSDEGMDLYCALPILSAYLGHSSVSATEKYLRLTAEMHGRLLDQISEAYGDIVPPVGTEVRIEY